MAEDVTLTVGGSAIGGWTSVRVTRRCEAVTNDFDVALTERFPGQPNDVVIQAGAPCTVALGGDTVITGYVDTYNRSYDGHAHPVSILGRGKCQDLVDCSAEYPAGQVSNVNALQLAQALAKPYGITVTAKDDPGAILPQFNVNLGETAWEIIEKVCRYAALLAYEGTDGNLVLSRIGDTTAASGFVEGQNVQAASVSTTMSNRYSDIGCSLVSTQTFNDVGPAGGPYDQEPDPNVPRHRLIYIVAEAVAGGQDLCKRRAQWEIARRAGRSRQVRVTTDSWRDSAGALWAPNTKAPFSLPGLKIPDATWAISEVTYRRDQRGTTAELMLMDPTAFTLEPILLQPQYADIKGAAAGGGTPAPK